MVAVRPSEGKGRGVFALKDFAPGEVIERAPVIVIPAEQTRHIEATVLDNYTYCWGEEGKELALVLGAGSVYNHSSHPNAVYERAPDELEMRYVALREIAEGEEIFINYLGRSDDTTPVVFEGSSWRIVEE